MANWDKLNKEFETALNSMTDDKWIEFKAMIDKKREENRVFNLACVSIAERKLNALKEVNQFFEDTVNTHTRDTMRRIIQRI